MRTTIQLDDELLAEAKQLAARTGRTLTGIIEEALRAMLAGQQGAAQRYQVRLTTVSGHGVQPGVDPDDSAYLLDLMKGDHVRGPDSHRRQESQS
jgi:hypothetical protein